MATLAPGQRAPDFTLPDQEGREVRLGDYRGGTLLLYFYPRADTPGCTAQACSIRDSGEELSSLGIAVLGISPDSPEAQQKFDRKYSLGFPLLSDPDHTAAERYGVWGEKKMFGKTSMGIIRSSFLLDEKGTVVQAWYGVKPKETVPKATAALAELP